MVRRRIFWVAEVAVFLVLITLFCFVARVRATTYNTSISVDGTINDTSEWAADEKFTSFVGSFGAFYITWTDTYLYFAFNGGTVSSDRYVVAIDTDPGGTAGDSGEWGGVSFPSYGSPDYIVEYKGGAIYTRGGVNGGNVLRAINAGANTLELGIPRSELGGLNTAAQMGVYLYAGYDSGGARTFAFFPPGHGNSVSGSTSVTAVTEWHFATTDAGRAPTTYGRYQSDIWSGATVNVAAGDNFHDVILDGGTLVGPTDGVFNVAGDFHYDATHGGIFTLSNCTVNFDGAGTIKGGHPIGVTFNHISIASGATLAADSNLRVQGDWINAGTFTANTGTVEFWGNSGNSSRVLGSATTTFYDATISCSNCSVGNTYGVDFYDHDTDRRTHIAGTLTLNQYTFVASEEDGSSTSCVDSIPDPLLGQPDATDECDGTPIYNAGSNLVYNNSGSFSSGAEWWPDDANPTCGSDKGMPYNVIIQNDTAVDINAAFNNNSRDPSYLGGSNKTACGSLTVDSGSTLQSTGGTFSVKGDLANGGSFVHNSGAVTLNGSSAQTLGGSSTTTFSDLTINNSSVGGIILGVDQEVAGTLTLTDGLVKVGAHTLTIGQAGSINGGAVDSMVVTDSDGLAAGDGWLCKEFDTTANPAPFTFPVGDVYNNANYSRGVLDFSSISGAGTACVQVTDAEYNASYENRLTRYWNVGSNIGSFACDVTFYYDAGSEDVIGTEDYLNALKYPGPVEGDAVDTTNHCFSMTGLGSFSDFTAGGITPTAVKLLAFAGRPASSGILLAWETATEEDNAGFHLYRSTRIDAVGVRLNAALIPSQAPGGGQGAAYTLLDATAEPGTTYYYTLEDVDLNGTPTPHGPVAAALWRAYLPLVGRQ